MPSDLKSSSRIGGSHILALAPPVPTSNKPLHCFCEHLFHNKSCDARAWCPPVFSGGRRSFLSRFCYPFMPITGTLSAKTIPDSVNVVWSISSAGLPPPLSLSDSASPDPSRLKPTAYRLPLFMLAGDGGSKRNVVFDPEED